MQSKSCVYWIHLPEHTDMFTQGYIGVSKAGAVERYRQHKSDTAAGGVFAIHNAIRKYGDKLVVDTIIKAPIEYCYEIECKLRPKAGIGYNIVAGGISGNLGVKHSPEAIAKISAAGKGRVVSSETKEKMSKSALSRGQRPSKQALENSIRTNSKKIAWLCQFSDKNIWMNAANIYLYMIENPFHGIRKVGAELGIVHTKLQTIHKKIKSGWNPLEDKEWLIFSSKLSPDASGDKSIQSAELPN